MAHPTTFAEHEIDQLLSNLEEEHQNELELIHHIDPSFFSTDCLLEMLEDWRLRHIEVRNYFNRIVWLAISSPVWLAIGIFALAKTGYTLLSGILLFFPLSLFLSLVGMLHINKKYGGIRYHRQIGESIKKELQERQNMRLYRKW